MRAVIYARYSSDNQRDESIEDQIRVCRGIIDAKGWSLASVYSDAAISGATTLRPGYQKLLEDARGGVFDVIVAEALDRLSRDQEDVASLYKHLSFAGVDLVTVAEGEVNELHVGLKGTMNALYLKDLAAKTRRGLEGRVRQGRSGGGISYGYDVIREVDASGEPVRGGRSINDAEAAIVRRIFSEFAAGASPRTIARRLNAEKIPGPGSRSWSDTTIRGHHTRRTGILHNDLYIGRMVWNKQRYVKDPRTGRRLARLNSESAWITHELPELRIIDQELWDRVEARLGRIRKSPGIEKAKATRFWENRRPKHLFTGLIVCGGCGSPFASVGRTYLACSAARRQGTCSNKRGIPRTVLENLILDALTRHLMAPDLVKAFIIEFHAELNRLNRERENGFALKRRALDETSRKLDGLIEAVADGLRTPGLKAKLDELEQRKADLEAELTSAPLPAPRLHPNLAEIYRRKVENLHASLAAPETRTEAIEILRGLIDKIRLRPIEKGFEIELVGEIAKMIALPGGPRSAELKAYTSSVKVVAGTRYQRYLQIAEGWIPHALSGRS
jgi:DNA invertase Pin-like site-specific DNA recombinase